MIEYEVAVPQDVDLSAAADLVAGCCCEEGLVISLDGPLRSYTGSRYMHFRRAGQHKEKGTLEATVWPDAGRIWLKVQSSRAAPWTEDAAERVRACIENSLAL